MCLRKGTQVPLWPPGTPDAGNREQHHPGRTQSGPNHTRSVTFLIIVTRAAKERRADFGHSLGVQSIMAGQAQPQGLEVAVHMASQSITVRKAGSRNEGSWSHGIHTQEAESDECPCSADFLLISPPACGMVLLTFKVTFPTSMSSVLKLRADRSEVDLLCDYRAYQADSEHGLSYPGTPGKILLRPGVGV